MSIIGFHGQNDVGRGLSPDEITGLISHWDASIGANVTVDGSDQVITFADDVGTVDLVSVSGNEPLYDSANDRIHFRGDTRVEFLEKMSFGYTGVTEYTIVLVWEQITHSASKGIWGMAGTGVRYHRSRINTTPTFQTEFRNTSSAGNATPSMPSATQKLIYIIRFNEASDQKTITEVGGAEGVLAVDMTLDDNDFTRVAFGSIPRFATTGSFFAGFESEAYWYEGIHYDNFISDKNLDQLVLSLRIKHNI